MFCSSYLPLPVAEGRGKETVEPRFVTLLFVIMETLDSDLETALPEWCFDLTQSNCN